MVHPAAILEKLPLLLANTDDDVAKRLRVFLLRFLPRDERYLGALPDLGGMKLPVSFPRGFRHRLNRRMQGLAHPCADGKADAPARPAFPSLIPQPVHQVTFVTGRIAPIVILVYRAGQGGKGRSE